MNIKTIYLGVILLNIFSINIFAQLYDSKILDVNNVEALFLANGMFFYDTENDIQIYNVPKGENKQTIFTSGIWVGGIDNNNQLHLAAQTYRQNGDDFWPGPLNENGIIGEGTSSNWNRIWKINKTEINTLIADFEDNGTIDNTIPMDILEWPGRNNSNLSFIPQDQSLAPFIDKNGDGKYDPYQGDLPKIKGDQMLWWVFNDQLRGHTESGGAKLGIEVQAIAFAIGCTTDSIIDNTVYVELDIINKSNRTYDSLIVGLFADLDIGNPSDDYIGSDVANNRFIGYNADMFDEDFGPIEGYGNNIPIQSVRFTNQKIHSFMYYNSGYSMLGDPETAEEYYFYMNSRWKDGTPLLYGGRGHISEGGDPTRPQKFMFPSSPDDGSADAWSECNIDGMGTPSVEGDKRGLGSTKPQTFAPGESINLQIAYTTYWGINYPCPKFPEVKDKYIPTYAFSLPEQVCVNENINLQLNTTDQIDEVTWDFGDGSVNSTSLMPTHQYSKEGTYSITLTIIHNCVETKLIKNITIRNNLPINIGNDTIICNASEYLIKSSPEYATGTYNWSTGETTQDITITNSGTYSLSVNLNDCIGKDSIDIQLSDCNLFLPNAFSPNNDGINDEFKFSGNGIISLSLNIYNRKGALVYQTSDKNSSWDGKNSNGQDLPNGVYTYYINATYISGERMLKNGNITLIN